MGEPAGIGPEISAKALSNKKIYEICNPVIIGDKNIIEKSLSNSKIPDSFSTISYDRIEDVNFEFGEIAVLDLKNILDDIPFGVDTEAGGRAVGEYIEKAVNLALQKKIHAIVTAPISKKAFQLGGWGMKYQGHTEMLADLTNSKKFTMLLAHGSFRVVHVTVHLPLKDAISKVTKSRVIETIELAVQACQMFGIKNPHIAMCALNPHAGEGGKLGSEEIDEILPAVQECKKIGINVDGPLPGDTVWPKVKSGYYDIGIANYHDQGHIPTKLLGFQYNKEGNCIDIHGVNITIGIPIIRVSVDHGTAYGKAGKGIASPNSIIDSIEIATSLANKKFFQS